MRRISRRMEYIGVIGAIFKAIPVVKRRDARRTFCKECSQLSRNPRKKDSAARHDWSTTLETRSSEILLGTYRGASMATKRVPDTQTHSMKLNEGARLRKGEKGTKITTTKNSAAPTWSYQMSDECAGMPCYQRIWRAPVPWSVSSS